MRSRPRRSAVVPSFSFSSLLLLGAVGCGGTVSGVGPSPTADAGDSPDASAASEPALRPGVVSIFTVAGGEDGAMFASAFFDAAGLGGAAPDVACEPVPPSSAPRPSASAGTIAIQVATGGAPLSLDLAYDAKKRDYPIEVVWGSADRDRLDVARGLIRVEAEGGAVPSFSAEIAAADDASFDAPADGDAIGRESGDLVVRWPPTTNDEIYASLNVGEASVSCRFPAAFGKGVIPAALVKDAVDAAGRAPSAFVLLASLRLRRVVAGDYEVVVMHGLMARRELTVPGSG